MTETPLSSPVYQIPLTDNELIIVGRITVVWAQIDHHLGYISAELSGLGILRYLEKHGDRQITGKLALLQTLLSACKSPPRRRKLLEAHQAISLCVSDRNMMAHGMWGYGILRDENTWVACSRSPRRDEPMLGGELPELHERVVTASLRTDIAFYDVVIKEPVLLARNRAQVWAEPEDMNQDGTPKIGPPPKHIR